MLVTSGRGPDIRLTFGIVAREHVPLVLSSIDAVAICRYKTGTVLSSSKKKKKRKKEQAVHYLLDMSRIETVYYEQEFSLQQVHSAVQCYLISAVNKFA